MVTGRTQTKHVTGDDRRIEYYGVDIFKGYFRFLEAIFCCVYWETGIMFSPSEALFLRARSDITVTNQCSGRIVKIAGNP